jgi:hypothetical protein
LKKTKSFRTKERQRAESACLKSLVRADGHRPTDTGRRTHASMSRQTRGDTRGMRRTLVFYQDPSSPQVQCAVSPEPQLQRLQDRRCPAHRRLCVRRDGRAEQVHLEELLLHPPPVQLHLRRRLPVVPAVRTLQDELLHLVLQILHTHRVSAIAQIAFNRLDLGGRTSSSHAASHSRSQTCSIRFRASPSHASGAPLTTALFSHRVASS